jgi:hypothetical protein
MTHPSDDLTLAQQARIALRVLRSESQDPAIVALRERLLDGDNSDRVTKALDGLTKAVAPKKYYGTGKRKQAVTVTRGGKTHTELRTVGTAKPTAKPAATASTPGVPSLAECRKGVAALKPHGSTKYMAKINPDPASMAVKTVARVTYMPIEHGKPPRYFVAGKDYPTIEAGINCPEAAAYNKQQKPGPLGKVYVFDTADEAAAKMLDLIKQGTPNRPQAPPPTPAQASQQAAIADHEARFKAAAKKKTLTQQETRYLHWRRLGDTHREACKLNLLDPKKTPDVPFEAPASTSKTAIRKALHSLGV